MRADLSFVLLFISVLSRAERTKTGEQKKEGRNTGWTASGWEGGGGHKKGGKKGKITTIVLGFVVCRSNRSTYGTPHRLQLVIQSGVSTNISNQYQKQLVCCFSGHSEYDVGGLCGDRPWSSFVSS